MLPQQPLVLQQDPDRHPRRRAQGQSLQPLLIQRRDPPSHPQLGHHLTEIPRQSPRPAQRIHAVFERGRHQFMKTMHQLDAGIAGGQGERSHARAKKGQGSAGGNRDLPGRTAGYSQGTPFDHPHDRTVPPEGSGRAR